MRRSSVTCFGSDTFGRAPELVRAFDQRGIRVVPLEPAHEQHQRAVAMAYEVVAAVDDRRPGPTTAGFVIDGALRTLGRLLDGRMRAGATTARRAHRSEEHARREAVTTPNRHSG